MRPFSRCAALMSLGLIAGCGVLATESAAEKARGCPQPAVIEAGHGITDFRERVAHQSTVAPPDSVLNVNLMFRTEVLPTDTARVKEFRGTITYRFQRFPSLNVLFQAADLGRYVLAADTMRLQDASLGLMMCAL